MFWSWCVVIPFNLPRTTVKSKYALRKVEKHTVNIFSLKIVLNFPYTLSSVLFPFYLKLRPTKKQTLNWEKGINIIIKCNMKYLFFWETKLFFSH